MPVVHVVPHTHWDREWYLPFQRFRLKLVGLVDRLLDLMEADERYRFTLDGQLATVDDYLEVRPEAEKRIRRLVDEGRLAIGPWQILMDEFFVSGETIVRNLEQGLRRGDELGGAMRIGYLPDMFGHVAQMPQLLRTFGIDQAVVWRGVPAVIDRHVFDWEAPDGSSVRAEYLPHGYGNAATLLDVPGPLDDRLNALRESHREFFDDDALLAMYGTDHMEPLPELADLVEASGPVARLSTLPDYVGSSDGRAVPPRWRGELRSGARANLLMGTISARIDLKAAMARAERAVARYAEPFQALYADSWPERLLELAWQRIIDCSAHDSICGCSADEVSAQVLVRCAESEQIGRGLAEEAAAQVAREAPRGSVVVLNPSPQPRTGLVELNLRVPDDWDELALELPDGTLAAVQELERNEPVVHNEEVRGAEVSEWLRRRIHGRELYSRSLNGFVIGERTLTLEVDEEEDPAWLDVDELKREVDIATQANAEAAWTVRIEARPRRRVVANVPTPPLGWTSVVPVEGLGELERPVAADSQELDNGLLRVQVADDGTLTLGEVEGVGRLVDGRDIGDSYNYAPPEHDRIVDSPDNVSVQLTALGPIRGELTIVRGYDWGEPVDVTTRVELRAGEPFCRLRISFDNPVGDHRLRFHVPLPEAATSSSAEGQFAVVERGLEAEGGFGERPLPTFPAHGFVAAGGMAVLLDHVIEYELVDGRELALTLLRSIGLISRNAHPYRESPAGPELEIPDAQRRGPWSISFALFPHDGTWDEAGVLEQLERYRHPFLTTGAMGKGDAREGAGPELRGEGVVLSSLRRREGQLQARLVNQSARPIEATFGEVELNLRPWEVRSVDLP